MEITHEIREYIIVVDENRYSVRHDITEDFYGVWRIEENEAGQFSFVVSNELMGKIKEIIKNSKQK